MVSNWPTAAELFGNRDGRWRHSWRRRIICYRTERAGDLMDRVRPDASLASDIHPRSERINRHALRVIARGTAGHDVSGYARRGIDGENGDTARRSVGGVHEPAARIDYDGNRIGGAVCESHRRQCSGRGVNSKAQKPMNTRDIEMSSAGADRN